jgi:hypothetical protein
MWNAIRFLSFYEHGNEHSGFYESLLFLGPVNIGRSTGTNIFSKQMADNEVRFLRVAESNFAIPGRSKHAASARVGHANTWRS